MKKNGFTLTFCVGMMLATLATAFSTDLTTGIVGWWRFNGTVSDRSPTGADGTLYGDGVFVEGQHGQALAFPGTAGTYVNCGSHAAQNFGTNTSFSIAFWARIEATGQTYDGIVGRKLTRGTNRPGYLIMVEPNAFGTAGFLKLDIRDTDEVGIKPLSAVPVHDGVWRHYAATADRAGSAQIYINGEPSGAAVSMAPLGNLDSQTALIVGSIGAANSQWFKGDLDELILWNRALSAEEVMAVYRHFPPRPSFVTIR